jgi:hypothetical protein
VRIARWQGRAHVLTVCQRGGGAPGPRNCRARTPRRADQRWDPFPPPPPPKLAGPTEESNWVIFNHLLVGAYPSSTHDAVNEHILKGILKLGCTTFVCLQQECVGERGG